MRRLSVLVLLTAFSCQASTLEEGDAQFRMANYHRALEIYNQAPASDQNLARIQRARYFLLEQNVRDLLHLGRPEDAATVLSWLEQNAPADRLGELKILRERSRLQIARQHYALGYDYSENNNPTAAAEELRLALSWNADYPEAKDLLARTDTWIETQKRIGEDYYFRGMEHLRSHHDLRARTSFMHAAELLGQDSFAESRLHDITMSLAEESRSMGRLYLEAGLTGPAWVSILDSIHLNPTNQEAQDLARSIEAQVESAGMLISADVAVRGGVTAAADALLEKARKLGVVQHAQKLSELAEANQDQKNQERYRRARAYELDNQMVHALNLYRAILVDEGGFAWEDVDVRAEAISQRLLQTEQAYQKALQAETAGNVKAYADALIEALHLSADYKDIHQRFLALPIADEK